MELSSAWDDTSTGGLPPPGRLNRSALSVRTSFDLDGTWDGGEASAHGGSGVTGAEQVDGGGSAIAGGEFGNGGGGGGLDAVRLLGHKPFLLNISPSLSMNDYLVIYCASGAAMTIGAAPGGLNTSAVSG